MNKQKPARSAATSAPLGDLSVKKFLSQHWQQRPLLVRQAFAKGSGFAPLTNAEILQLASYDEAEARSISHQNKIWTLEHGPFTRQRIRALRKVTNDLSPREDTWTVLIQDTQHFSHEAHRLLSNFAFLPYARIDDLMVSYAVKGGGVGPHVDSYDVFLLQGSGRRRWRISSQRDHTLVDGAPMKILKRFKAEQEWVLEEGDMLYLPPGFAHHGIAETDECVTWSIGFRAPSDQELLDAFLDQQRDTLCLEGRYRDPNRQLAQEPAFIDSNLRRKPATGFTNALEHALKPSLVARFIGEYLTATKAHVEFIPPSPRLSLASFERSASKQGVGLDLRSRMLFDDENFYMNGRALVFDGALTESEHSRLRDLANSRRLHAHQLNSRLIRRLYPYCVSGEIEFLE